MVFVFALAALSTPSTAGGDVVSDNTTTVCGSLEDVALLPEVAFLQGGSRLLTSAHALRCRCRFV